MKRKGFLVVLFLILAIFLSGCGGVVTPDTDEAKVKGVIQNYASAMNNQDWDKAKGYCVYNSWAYWMVESYEFLVDYYEFEIFTFKVDIIRDIEVEGDYAQADIHIVDSILVRWELTYLQKVGGVWKIYNSYAHF
ncbi:hypothetical protein ES708_23933 [subsurface metagenome]